MGARARSVKIHHRVVYSSPGGRPLRGTFFLPAAEPGPGHLRPAIVLIHGGSWSVGSRRQMWWYGRRYAREGFAALSITYRKLPRYRYPDCLEDVRAAVRWLRQEADRWRIDPAAVALQGESSGGHLALMAALTAEEPGGEPVAAAVSLYGPTDLRYYLEPRGHLRWGNVGPRVIRRFTSRLKGTDHERTLAASPLSRVHSGAPPVLLIHGRRDRVVPWQQSSTLADELSRQGAEPELVLVPKRGHAFDYFHPGQRRAIFHRIVAFLARTRPMG